MATEYMKAKTDAEREALARKIAKLRLNGTPWDGRAASSIQCISSRPRLRVVHSFGSTSSMGRAAGLSRSWSPTTASRPTRAPVGERGTTRR